MYEQISNGYLFTCCFLKLFTMLLSFIEFKEDFLDLIFFFLKLCLKHFNLQNQCVFCFHQLVVALKIPKTDPTEDFYFTHLFFFNVTVLMIFFF